MKVQKSNGKKTEMIQVINEPAGVVVSKDGEVRLTAYNRNGNPTRVTIREWELSEIVKQARDLGLL